MGKTSPQKNTKNFSQKGLTRNLLALLNTREKQIECCTDWLTGVSTLDTDSIHFEGDGDAPLQAFVKISAQAGNNLVVLGDGLYTTGGGGGGNVSSVFGRVGNVVAANGDYNTSQVTENTNLYFTNARAIAAPITGYVSAPGVISASDSVLSAIGKLNGNIETLSWDDTLAVSNTTSRTLNFVAAADGYEIFRAFTNSVNNTAPYQLIIDRTPNGPPDDNVRYEGWNIDSQFDPSSPSWTTRLEFKYLGSLYEYHLQWSSLVAPRTFRLMSHTFHDTGSAATDTNTLFFSATQFEIRDFATNNSFVLISSTGGGTTLSVVDTTGNSGVSYSFPVAPGTSCTVSPQGTGTLDWIFAPTWGNIYFGNTLHWASAKPTFLNGLAGTDSNAFEVNSAGGQSTIVLRSSGTASLVQNETFNQSYYAANNSGGHFFWTASAVALADFQIDAVGPSHIWNSTRITNPTGTGTDLLIRSQIATHNASIRLLLPDTDLGLQFYTLNSAYVTNGVFVARSGAIIATQAAGMAIACNDAAGTIRFAAGSLTECARFEETGKLTFAGSLTTRAIMNLVTGPAPTSPVDGDIWREDNTNTGLKIRINGVTKTITVS